ncbi:MAG: TIGR03435 family protein [Candidatus Acidiferrales bacterium]
MKRAFAIMCYFVLLSSAAFGQSATTPAAAPAAFDVADVHTSPKTTFPFFQGGVLQGTRYVLRNATMVDLIATAYGVDNNNVLGGPSWLETDHFDVIAKVSPGTTMEAIKPMLQAMLTDRFKLALHQDTKPMPVFVLTVGKGNPKLKEADPAGTTGCGPSPNQQPPTPGTVFYIMVTCKNMTMEAFAEQVHQMAGGYLTNPVVDQTGLKGAWDFDIKWTGRGALAQAGADGISIFDAVDKQLGLKLDAQRIPLPVYVVDSANEKPTDNPPSVAANMPPAAPAEFEVAVIKPSPPGATQGGRVDPAGRIDLQAITLKDLITIAWDLDPRVDDMLVGAPKWLGSDKFDIVAKISTSAPTTNSQQLPDIEDLRKMLRALLIERFEMVVRNEDRPISAYTLTAVNPKLKKADPSNRTACKEGPGADGKDPRISNPILSRLITCLNMTMPQFAEQLRLIAGGYIFTPVQDATGLEGAYDFTLSFSTAGQFNGGGRGVAGGGAPPASDTPTASDPTGALSIFDAVSKQLGLKLEMRKRPVSVLVIDHVEEKPTDN